MEKWADYLISEVSYDSDHLISIAIRHKDTVQGITEGKSVDRLTIASDIKNGLLYITIYNQKNTWKKGHRIQTFSIGGTPYLRIDQNKVQLDFLGDLPEPVESEEEATPEQLLRLEQLEKQIQELEIRPSQVEPLSSPRGSLPKASTEELPQELDLAPEPVESEEEATPEQLSQLNDLQQQIDELESILSSKLNSSFDDPTPEQFSKIEKLEREIKQLEESNIEQKIIQKLHKQNKKLDNIERKLRDSETPKIQSTSLESYCVKCKTKRKIENAEEIVMKNGRPGVRGICSICHSKVFRIGKMNK